MDKINLNERLFSSKSNFRDLVDSISFYNPSNNKETTKIMENDEELGDEDEDDYEDEEDEDYEYYNNQGMLNSD